MTSLHRFSESRHGQALPQDQNQVTTQKERRKLSFIEKEMIIPPESEGLQNSQLWCVKSSTHGDRYWVVTKSLMAKFFCYYLFTVLVTFLPTSFCWSWSSALMLKSHFKRWIVQIYLFCFLFFSFWRIFLLLSYCYTCYHPWFRRKIYALPLMQYPANTFSLWTFLPRAAILKVEFANITFADELPPC